MKNTLILSVVALLALGAGLFWQLSSHTPARHQGFTLSLPDSTGKPRSLEEWRGNVVIVNFWATWCPPCLEEIPEFIRLQTQYRDQPVQFVGIAIDNEDAVQEFILAHPVNYPMLIAGDNALSMTASLGNLANVLPYSIILNQQGQIVYRHTGLLPAKKLEEQLAELL